MSASREQSSEHEKGIPNGTSEHLAPELPLRLSRELHSSDLPSSKATLSSSPGPRKDIPRADPRRPLTQTATSLSTSRSPSRHRSRSYERSSVSSPPLLPFGDNNQGVKDIIIRSFAPRVAVYASTDTEDFLRNKGFKDGLCGLVRPYGERLQGKVIIRDSIGGSKAWDDFGIRFVDSQQLRRSRLNYSTSEALDTRTQNEVNGFQAQHEQQFPSPSQSLDFGTAIDRVLNHSLDTGDGDISDRESGCFDRDSGTSESRLNYSPLYCHYLHKLLSSAPIVPYETFCHPVACMIAVSSRHPAPIEALRQLYASTGHGTGQAPTWISTEYLRYYVLIHDEENDDIVKSTALFDLMKRHFGLHCHLLRLKSSQCVPTDDDSARVPRCEWLAAEEEMDRLRARDYTDDLEIAGCYISESDATAVRAFLREMVTQSIVPFMENRVMTWNDQVASRRRGISGRFISLSKRWTGFGSSKNATTGSGVVASSPGSNYDHQQGFYPPGTPEATMRQLGDYAFMLRDWKLACSTYDFLRTDFSHDKAWAYYAAVNEMAAITSLLIPHALNSKSRSEALDQMLDNAVYSYLTRCSMSTNIVRCLTLATELLQTRDPVALDDAARWGSRLLELNVLTPFAQALMTERLADCYAFRKTGASPFPNSRRRQAALWNVMASDCWIRIGRWSHARRRLQLARELYDITDQSITGPHFANMQPLWQKLDDALRGVGSASPSALIDLGDERSLGQGIDQESEQLNAFTNSVDMSYTDTEGFTPQDARYPEPITADDR